MATNSRRSAGPRVTRSASPVGDQSQRVAGGSEIAALFPKHSRGTACGRKREQSPTVAAAGRGREQTVVWRERNPSGCPAALERNRADSPCCNISSLDVCRQLKKNAAPSRVHWKLNTPGNGKTWVIRPLALSTRRAPRRPSVEPGPRTTIVRSTGDHPGSSGPLTGTRNSRSSPIARSWMTSVERETPRTFRSDT